MPEDSYVLDDTGLGGFCPVKSYQNYYKKHKQYDSKGAFMFTRTRRDNERRS